MHQGNFGRYPFFSGCHEGYRHYHIRFIRIIRLESPYRSYKIASKNVIAIPHSVLSLPINALCPRKPPVLVRFEREPVVRTLKFRRKDEKRQEDAKTARQKRSSPAVFTSSEKKRKKFWHIKPQPAPIIAPTWHNEKHATFLYTRSCDLYFFDFRAIVIALFQDIRVKRMRLSANATEQQSI